MTTNTPYRLHRQHKFEHGGCKYVADLESGDIVQLNDVEWEILQRYDTQSRYQIVEGLKERHKVVSIFEGIKRLEQLGARGKLLRPIEPIAHEVGFDLPETNSNPKLLVPFHFTNEKGAFDYITNLNRYQFLMHLGQFAALETFQFSEAGDSNPEQKEFEVFGDIRIRTIESKEKHTFAAPWYAIEGYDGILLLSQLLTDDPLYYRVPDVPIVHCIEGSQKLQSSLSKTFLTLYAFQKPNDTFVVKASWMKEWLGELGVPAKSVRVIPDGINTVDPIGKALAKQHTAALFEKPMFAQQPIVGLISGFEPNYGVKLISAFARANPHLAIFVYDPVLAEHSVNLSNNVVIFSADDEETLSVLPIFFQALDLVCFPAIPGTPLSLVLEAMAYGTPCVAMTKYGLPPEVESAGAAVKLEWRGLGNFRVSMSELSDAVNQWLKPSPTRAECKNVARDLAPKFTWEKTVQEVLQLFADGYQQTTNAPIAEKTLLPSIFCRQYDPGTGTTTSGVYRLGTNRYEHLETALVEILSEHHTPTEVEFVFKHFRGKSSTPVAK